jgi:hypothetical protein
MGFVEKTVEVSKQRLVGGAVAARSGPSNLVAMDHWRLGRRPVSRLPGFTDA